MTAPYRPEAAALIAGNHRQIVRATAVHARLSAPLHLDLLDLDLSFDENRSPRAVADITIDDRIPVEQLDPRTGVRVEIWAGYVHNDGREDVALVADLGIRDVDHDKRSHTVRIRAAGDESLVVDASPAVTGTVTASSHAAAIAALIRQCIDPAPQIVSAVAGPAVTVDPVLDRWDTIEDLADRIEADVYDRGDRSWRIEARPELAGWQIAHTLTRGPSGTELSHTSRISRDSWANYVILTYRWRDPATDEDKEVQATAYVSSGPYYIAGPAGRRIETVDRQVQTTQAEANATAAAILRRFLSRSNSRSLTAVAAWWLRPGHTVKIDDTLELVSSVQFSIDGSMSLVTRVPVEHAASSSTPPAAPRTNDPTPPARDTYVSTWEASSNGSYLGNGTRRLDRTDLVQGYAPEYPAGGSQKAIALFTAANSTGDDVGKTITAALPAGSDIVKVEARFYLTHTYSGAGSIAQVGAYAGTSLPSSWTANPVPIASSHRARGEVWVNITSRDLIAGLLNGTVRGLTLGSTSRSTDNYLRAAGSTATPAQRPAIRLTIAR